MIHPPTSCFLASSFCSAFEVKFLETNFILSPHFLELPNGFIMFLTSNICNVAPPELHEFSSASLPSFFSHHLSSPFVFYLHWLDHIPGISDFLCSHFSVLKALLLSLIILKFYSCFSSQCIASSLMHVLLVKLFTPQMFSPFRILISIGKNEKYTFIG